MTHHEVLAVAPELTRPLRREVLRPGTPLADLSYDNDRRPGALHAAVRLAGGAIVSVASVAPDPHPRDPRPGDWRVRGMATRADMRGRGYGAAVLALCERHAREQGAARIWCNARIGARDFYARAGLVVEGDEFEIESIGTHFLMSKPLL